MVERACPPKFPEEIWEGDGQSWRPDGRETPDCPLMPVDGLAGICGTDGVRVPVLGGMYPPPPLPEEPPLILGDGNTGEGEPPPPLGEGGGTGAV